MTEMILFFDFFPVFCTPHISTEVLIFFSIEHCVMYFRVLFLLEIQLEILLWFEECQQRKSKPLPRGPGDDGRNEL